LADIKQHFPLLFQGRVEYQLPGENIRRGICTI
jgi:hypothetical protein